MASRKKEMMNAGSGPDMSKMRGQQTGVFPTPSAPGFQMPLPPTSRSEAMAPAERGISVPQLGLNPAATDVAPMTVTAAQEGKEYNPNSEDKNSLNPTNERRGEVVKGGVKSALEKFQ